jgi:hypothetical protein
MSYNCTQCGQWVPDGIYHICPIVTYYQYPVSPCFYCLYRITCKKFVDTKPSCYEDIEKERKP